MAYVKDETGVAQTAANVSATIVSAFVDKFDSFDDAVEAFNELRAATFKDLAAVVQADNAKFAAEDAASNGSKAKTAYSTTTSKTIKTGARGKSTSTRSKLTLEDALAMEMKYGAFEGESLQTIVDLGVEQCDEDYSYGDGERNGRDYIAWLAGTKNENDYVKVRARLVATHNEIEYTE